MSHPKCVYRVNGFSFRRVITNPLSNAIRAAADFAEINGPLKNTNARNTVGACTELFQGREGHCRT